MHIFQYFILWLRFTIAYAWKDVFGWAGGLMTVIGTVPYYALFPQWAAHLITNQNKIIASVSFIVTTLALAFIINCVVSSPYRVWAEFHALAVKVPNNSAAPPENVGAGKLKTSVRLLVKNKSSKPITCRIKIIEINAKGSLDRGYNTRCPWLVNTTTIYSKDENLVEIASCFFGNNTECIRIFNEFPGTFAESSVMYFKSSCIQILIEASTDHEVKRIWCKITKDTHNRTLSMEAIAAAPAFSASSV